MKTRSNQSRRGVTLLFVISMIVLFLLMGTTFVIVSNDFLRSSRLSSRVTVNSIESLGENPGQRFIEQALYQLLRGPDLDDVNSSLRGHSILADMYGYGMVAFVKGIEDSLIEPADSGFSTSNDGDQFVRLELIGMERNYYSNNNTLNASDFDDTLDDPVLANDILSGNPIRYSSIGNAPGRFNGQILSFVSGEMAGVSCRIIDHQVFVEQDPPGIGDPVTRHKLVVMPYELPLQIQNGRLEEVVDVFDSNSEVVPTRVVINGRAFAGTGAGLFDQEKVGNDPAPPQLPQYALGSEGFSPNQRGKTRQELYDFNNGFGYLGMLNQDGDRVPNPYATNECYDAPDAQNMFLAGTSVILNDPNDANDNVIEFVPSFWRKNLHEISRGELFEYSFRPERIEQGGVAENGSTSDEVTYDRNQSAPQRLARYIGRKPEVDNNGFEETAENIDNGKEGVWIDINLPVFTDKLGRKIKPLVSYTVMDMDALLNINTHGNLSQIPSNQRFASSSAQPDEFLSPFDVTPYGGGFGPSEVYLGNLLGDEGAKRLMIGAPNPNGAFGSTATFIPGRYGGTQVDSDNDLQRGFGPVPGQEYVDASNRGQDPFSAYKMFGYPNYHENGDDFSILGGFYATPLDLYGRFRIGYPVAPFDNTLNFQTSMPVIDVYRTTIDYTELINNPYEADFSPPMTTISTFDNHFTTEEIEGVYRRTDRDFRQQFNRIWELAGLDAGPDFGRFITTDSWEVPTLPQEMMFSQFDFDGDGVMENLSQFENLMTKLYTVLATENHPHFGVNAPDPSTKHDLIMRNLTGFFHDPSNDTFGLNVDANGICQGALISNDIRSGRPFNINRPFGNGFDDDGDGIVDELGESNDLDKHPYSNSNLDFDYNQDSFIDNNDFLARQLFARQLYILTLLVTELVDRNGNGSVIDNVDFRDVVDSLGTTIQNNPNHNARREYRKMVAQWAINVVDFRDPDSINTAFEVDLNPFDGWDVDGILDPNNPDAVPDNEYFVAWGAERPELLITESFNGHDRRTEDRDDDNDIGTATDDPDQPDPTFDSRLVPQAFSFFELYHPWAHSVDTNGDFPNQFLPIELDPSGNGVDLALKSNGGNGAPVWRVVIANNLKFNEVSGEDTFQAGSNGFSYHQDPDEFNRSTQMRNNLTEFMIRRYVYFTDTAGASGTDEFVGNKVYAPPVGVDLETVVAPGGYVVAGSRGIANGSEFTTHLGRRIDGTEGDADTLLLDQTRRIVLNTDDQTVNVVSVNDGGGNVDDVRSALVFPLESVADFMDQANSSYRRSFSVSDPVNGYVTNDFSVLPITDGFKFVDANTGSDLVLDDPADALPPGGGGMNPFHGSSNDSELFANTCLTKDQYCSGAYVILLQRLADPTRNYNTTNNPYLTIDSKGSDLFCFNGVNLDDEPNPNNEDALAQLRLQTFERRGNLAGGDHSQQNPLRSRILWKTDYSGLNPPDDPGDPGDDLHFASSSLLPPPATPPPPSILNLVSSLGLANDSYVNTTGPPQLPFSWLTWNNRPFNSAYELANVPFTSSFFLTNRFDTSLKESAVDGGFLDNDHSPRDQKLYRNLEVPGSVATGEIQNDDIRVATYSGEFGHLLNFHADQTGGTNDERGAFQLHRLFDYVEVPSRYVGTETFINPERYVSGATDIVDARSSFSMSFAAPFDFVSNYRDPGKININTVPKLPQNLGADRIWDAFMRQGPDMNSPVQFDKWLESLGEEHQNPYRHAQSRNYVAEPRSRGRLPVQANQADVGLFRRAPTSIGAENEGLFDFRPPATDPFQNANRNAYFRNIVRQRLGNMTTMRSSVFAIWISVGYFEMVPSQGVDDNGDEKTLNFIGDEVEDENGTKTRNRGFFIFDRSIPVAFEPGRNHNVEKAIRVSSYIESAFIVD